MAAPFEEIHLNLSHFNLRNLADEAVALCAPLLEHKDLVITNHIGWDIPDVNANYEGVRQLLFNLLGQAIQNTDKGTVELWAQVNGESLLVRIANTCVSASQKPLDVLFKALSVGGLNCEANDFGLGCTRNYVEKIGGKLWVESLSNGTGSAITFSLPRVIGEQTRSAETAPCIPEVEQPFLATKPLVLSCVGGDELMWQQLRPLLQKSIGKVQILPDFVVDEQDACFRLWVLDAREREFPQLAEVRAKFLHALVPVLVITKPFSDEDLRFFELGATDVCSYKSLPEVLVARLKNLLDMAMRYRETQNKLHEACKARLQQLKELELKDQELSRNRFKMASQEKMATLGTLTAGIAHEIKNPLNFVNNFAESSVEIVQDLREELAKRKDQNLLETAEIDELMADLERNATDINKHGKRANHIVESMLDLTRGGVGQLKLTQINELVEEFSNYSHKGRKIKEGESKAVLQMDLEPKLVLVEIVPHDLGRVIINLVNNALDAVAQKSRSISDANLYKPVILIATRDATDWVEIRIRDNGPGVPSEVVKNMFSPFFTTKPTGDGNVGLGLAICYNIIAKTHHGELRVDTKPNEFTEFTIRLPKKQPVS